MLLSIYNRGARARGTRGSTENKSRDGGTFFDFGGVFYTENGTVESFMRWALTGSFEHSNRELLALSICRNMTVFAIHRSPWGSSGRPWGVPGASPGGLRDVPGGSQGASPGSHGRARGSRGVPWGPRGVPGASPKVPGACSGDLRDPRGLRRRPRHPRDPFHKDYAVIYHSVIRFRNMIP